MLKRAKQYFRRKEEEPTQFGNAQIWQRRPRQHKTEPKFMPKPANAEEQILVIKHGALGDFILALGPLAAIRAQHPKADITLLTTDPFVDLARESGYVDNIWIDRRPRWHQLGRWRELAQKLRSRQFDWVYDLQTSDRSSFYRHFLRPKHGHKPNWSGIAKGCSHPDDNPERQSLHTLERQVYQLQRAGIKEVPRPNFRWWKPDAEETLARFQLKTPYALLVPGGSAHRPEKRWPAPGYAQLAESLLEWGLNVAVVGGAADRAAIDMICRRCPKVVNLCERTELFDLITLGQKASLAVGNDTGPMHIFGLAGAPCLTLFSGASDPNRCRPRGPESDANLIVLQAAHLPSLTYSEVVRPARGLLPRVRG